MAEGHKRAAGVAAVKAGQAVLASALASHAPVLTGRLRASVRASRVGIGPHSVGGYVSVSTPYARAVERLRHFVNGTARSDGPRAIAAMAARLKG